MKRLTKEQKNKMMEMGKAAFKAGLPAIPIRDKEVMKEIANTNNMGLSAKKLDAWLKGWHGANLSNTNNEVGA